MKGGSVKIGVIGCGQIAQDHLSILSTIPEFEIKAVCDIKAELASSVAEAFGTHHYTDHKVMIDKEKLDCALICTPPSTHAEIGVDCMDKGLHVLCEKPLALNRAEAMRMAGKADKSGKVLMMASKFRYVDDMIKSKGIIEAGILGQLILFENVFCSRVEMGKRWNSDPKISGGGVLIDNGTHSVDIVRYLVGTITEVMAIPGARVQVVDVEDTCRMLFKTSSGLVGSIDLSWSITKSTETYIQIYGTHGTLLVGWKGSKYRQSDKLEWVGYGAGYSKKEALRRQARNFIDCMKGNDSPKITTEDAIESVAVIEAAYVSIASGRWEAVAPFHLQEGG